MADFTLPVLSSLYTDVLTLLKARDVDALSLGYSTIINPPTGAIRYVRVDNKFQEYGGADWNDKVLAIAGGGTGGATAAAARTSLGLGSMATQSNSAVSITGGTITGVALDASGFTTGTVALARGGTGASLSLGAAGTFIRSDGATVEFSTNGSAITALNASNLGSGTVPLARLSGITTTQMASANVSQFTNDAGYATVATASLPIASVVDYAGPLPLPAGVSANYLVCDGSAISRSTYAALFAIIGTTYGSGDGVNTFNLPDCRSRSSVGVDTSPVLGATGGSLSHTHASTGLSNDTHAGHTHSLSGTSGAGSSHTHGSFTGNSGPGSAHSHAGDTTASATPPNHFHGFTTDATGIGVSSANINEGDGTFGSVLAVVSLDSSGSHVHTGSTTGVAGSDLSHSHAGGTTGSESSHTHGGGTYAVGAESSHTHGAGGLAAATSGSHTHVISGSVAASSHAYIAFYKLIKYA